MPQKGFHCLSIVFGHPRSWHLSQWGSLPHEPLKLGASHTNCQSPIPNPHWACWYFPWHYWHAAWVRSRPCQPLTLHLREMQKSLWGWTLINCSGDCHCSCVCDWWLVAGTDCCHAHACNQCCKHLFLWLQQQQWKQPSLQPACCLCACNFVAQPKFVACLNVVLVASSLLSRAAFLFLIPLLALLLVTVVIPIVPAVVVVFVVACSLCISQSDEARTQHRFWIFLLQHCGIL